MQAQERIELSGPPSPTVLPTDEARQGVTGHNVRYVLGFALVGAIAAFLVVGVLAAHGWLAAL